jgi:hypothetical protein
MSLRLDGEVVRLEGDCRAADADALCAALVGQGRRGVDLSAATNLHTAVVQALLALAPPIVGEPGDPFLRRYVTPQLQTLPAHAPEAQS